MFAETGSHSRSSQNTDAFSPVDRTGVNRYTSSSPNVYIHSNSGNVVKSFSSSRSKAHIRSGSGNASGFFTHPVREKV